MVKANKYGQMGSSTKAIGKRTLHMDMAFYIIKMAIYMKVNGKKTSIMAKENTPIKTVPHTMANGNMTSSTAMLLKYCLIRPNLSVNFRKVLNKAMALSIGKMDHSISVILNKTR